MQISKGLLIYRIILIIACIIVAYKTFPSGIAYTALLAIAITIIATIINPEPATKKQRNLYYAFAIAIFFVIIISGYINLAIVNDWKVGQLRKPKGDIGLMPGV